MIRVIFVAAITLLLASAPLHAQHLLAQDALGGEFYSVDLRSGEFTLVGGAGAFLTTYNGLAADSQGTIYSVSQNINVGWSELHEVDPATGQLTYLFDVDSVGIGAIAFGPGDTLYGAANLSWPLGIAPSHLITINTATGTTTVIGQIASASSDILAMDFDGTTMFAWDHQRGLMTVDLGSGLGTDLDSSFVGDTASSKSMCFGVDGTLYLLDPSFWLCEPTTGVSSYVGPSYFGILGEVEYIPGPNQVLSLWQTEQVGNPTEIKVRGATPSTDVALFASVGPAGTYTIPGGFPCAGTVLDLNPTTVRLLTVATADAQGEVTLGPAILPPSALFSAQLQALDLQTCVTSNPIRAVW